MTVIPKRQKYVWRRKYCWLPTKTEIGWTWFSWIERMDVPFGYWNRSIKDRPETTPEEEAMADLPRFVAALRGLVS
jgi:hypothetical protein